MSRFIDKNVIASYFPYPPRQIVRTSGNREGLILKFSTYYLKIYDDEYGYNYIIEKYLYNHTNPISVDKIHVTKIREYTSKCSF